MGAGAALTVAGATLWTPAVCVESGWVQVEGDRIAAVGVGRPPAGPCVDAAGLTVCPGFIDLHIHGAFGHDVREGEAALVALGAGLPRFGCTAYLPTTIAAPWPQTLETVERLAAALEQAVPGAQALGLHLEGPFFNPLQRGMHLAENLVAPSAAGARALLDAGRGRVRSITLAPELPGGLDAVRVLAAAGVLVSIGHSDATYAQAQEAFAAGARHVTHCYSAMRGLHHREPGLLGAAMDLDGLSCEVIADGVHVYPAPLRLVWRAKGWRGLALVTDAMPGAGAGDGVYRFGGQDVHVGGGRAQLAGGALAGSVATMDQLVRTMVEAGVPARQAVGMATATPARIGGWPDRGQVAPGARADLVALDAELRVAWTMVGGQVVWRR